MLRVNSCINYVDIEVKGKLLIDHCQNSVSVYHGNFVLKNFGLAHWHLLQNYKQDGSLHKQVIDEYRFPSVYY